jgi:hypothetical protein
VINLTNCKISGRINPTHHTAFYVLCKTLRLDTLLVIYPHISRLHSTHYQTKATISVNVFFIKLLVLSWCSSCVSKQIKSWHAPNMCNIYTILTDGFPWETKGETTGGHTYNTLYQVIPHFYQAQNFPEPRYQLPKTIQKFYCVFY